jgi:hypothetical protein
MAKQTINIGRTANDKSGDPLRTAFNKINQNFTELYNQIPSQTGNSGKLLTTNGTSISWISVNTAITPTLIDGGIASTRF